MRLTRILRKRPIPTLCTIGQRSGFVTLPLDVNQANRASNRVSAIAASRLTWLYCPLIVEVTSPRPLSDTARVAGYPDRDLPSH